MAKVARLATGILLLLVSTVHAKVENSDKNDIATQNGTVQVLSIEDLNKTQYLNQNFRSGNYNYGYDVKPEGPNGQFHHENKAPDGVVFGCYGYVDPNDKPQITYYVSDSWGYRPVTVGNSAKVYYTADHSDTSTEMKGTLRPWAQLAFPKLCANYEQKSGSTPLGPMSLMAHFPPPPQFLRAQAGSVVSVRTATQTTSRGQVTYPGSGGKPGGPGILSEGGYGGIGGEGGFVSGSAAANGGPGGPGGNGGVSSGSSFASGGNGGAGGHAGVASGNSVANGGAAGAGGDGGEASGSSNSSGGSGGNGGNAGSASGSSNSNGGTAGDGGKGGLSSGSSVALGGNAADGGDGGNASGSSAAAGGLGGSGGRGGSASGTSSSNGGVGGAGGRGGNASGSSSASAGAGGLAGNGGVASGTSSANGGSGGLGGSGAGAGTYQTISTEKGSFAYNPPNGFVQRLPASAPPPGPLPVSGGLLAEELYTEEIKEQQKKSTTQSTQIPTIPVGRPTTTTVTGGSTFQSTESGYTYPIPPSQNQGAYGGTGQSVVTSPSTTSSSQETVQQQYYTGDKGLTVDEIRNRFPPQGPSQSQGQRPAPQGPSQSQGHLLASQGHSQSQGHLLASQGHSQSQGQRPAAQGPSQSQGHVLTSQGHSQSQGHVQASQGHSQSQGHVQASQGHSLKGQRPGSPLHGHAQPAFTQHQAGNTGNYYPGSGSPVPGGLLNPPLAGQSSDSDRFQNINNNFYPQKGPGFGQVPVPSGIYVPPTTSSESGESGDQNILGNDSGERDTSSGGSSCDQGYGGKCSTYQPDDSIDYAQLPGAISSNIPVIFYPDCRSNAYTRPAIVPFCPSLQQPQPATTSCPHHQQLPMKFPAAWNSFNNVPHNRGGYPSSFPYTKARPAKRVVLRTRRNHQSRYV